MKSISRQIAEINAYNAGHAAADAEAARGIDIAHTVHQADYIVEAAAYGKAHGPELEQVWVDGYRARAEGKERAEPAKNATITLVGGQASIVLDPKPEDEVSDFIDELARAKDAATPGAHYGTVDDQGRPTGLIFTEHVQSVTIKYHD